jgi:hypothetical protein
MWQGPIFCKATYSYSTNAGLWWRLWPQEGLNVQEYEPEIPVQSPDYLPPWVSEFNYTNYLRPHHGTMMISGLDCPWHWDG